MTDQTETHEPTTAEELSPFRAIAESVSHQGGELLERVSTLIEQARALTASQVNATLTLRNWYIGHMIEVAILDQEHADYGKQIVATLSQQLTVRHGRGFELTNLTRMIRFAQLYPDPQIVATLSRQFTQPYRDA